MLQIVSGIKETTDLNLVFKEMLQTSIPPLNSGLYAKQYHDFPLKNYCLTVPKNFVDEPFCVSQNFWYRKTLWMRGGGEGVLRPSVKKIGLTLPKIFVRESFSISLVSGIEKR